MALRSDGQVVAWGDNGWGQCDVPALPAGVFYVEVAAGYRHSLARRSDGAVVAWGSNANGQCNVPALPAGVVYVQIAAGMGAGDGGAHSLGRRSDGHVVAWGHNGYGQCDVPTLPAGVSYLDIAAGFRHSLARRSDGQVVGWGHNTYGQCDLPAAPGGTDYVEIAAGVWHSMARRSDGQVVAKGYDGFDETTVPSAPAGTSYVEMDWNNNHGVARYEQPQSCPSSEVYCTAKTNSLGCAPSISILGIPSASLGFGCTISTSNLVGQKPGLYLHSTSGAAALPFHGAFLCVQAPFKRHPATTTGGTAGLCNGVLSEDINAYIASGADPALVAGATLWIQSWSRDPGDPFGDSLSNALSALICP